MRSLRLLLAVLLALLLPATVFAQAAPQKCDGPAELCQQVLDLNVKLAQSKALKDAASAQTEKKVEDKVAVEVAKDDKKKEDRMAKLIASAATLAVGLKILLSLLDQWKGYFEGPKGKALLKLITLTVGLVAFLATNVGLGLPFWQSLILAGGGPGAILVHDLSDIVSVLRGKKKDLPADGA